jgi:formate hydrogenlyase subunit 3/multisubunit Na+/H+ antiporter MnhD subunit
MTANPEVGTVLLVVAAVLPWIVAAALAVPRLRSLAITAAPLAAVPALALALFGEPGTEIEIPWLFKHTVLLLDQTGKVFLGFTGLLYMAAAWYARSYLKTDPRKVRFFLLLLLAMGGNLGLILAGDVPTFFASFTVMGLASAGLVSHREDSSTRHAGRVYLSLTMLGEAMVLTGLVFLIVHDGTTEISQLHRGEPIGLAMFLLSTGFGIKAGALTLHFWLPLAHPAAPTPASAVLSGAMIKAGFLGWIRFLPLGEAAEPTLGFTFITAGLTAALLGALAGVVQTNPKTVLAYSSVCQMGILMTGLGIGAIEPRAWPGILAAVLIYTAHHALAKGALFLGIGPSAAAFGRREVLTARFGMLIPALALAGAPLTSGALAKVALKSNLVFLPDEWARALEIILPLAAVGTSAMMIRLLWLVWRPASDQPEHPAEGQWAPWLTLVAAVMAAAWLLPGAFDWLGVTLTPGKLWLATWPLFAGGLLVAIGATIRRRLKIDPSNWVPPGDVGVILGRLLAPLLARARVSPLAEDGHEYCDDRSETASGGAPVFRWFGQMLAQGEEVLASWPVAGATLLVVTCSLLALLIG